MIEAPTLSRETTPRRDQILAKLRAIAATLMDVDADDLDVERNFLELGADSLTLMDASRAIQDSFGVTLSIRLLLEEISNFANLAVYIDQSLPPAAESVHTAAAPSIPPPPAACAPAPPPRAPAHAPPPAPVVVQPAPVFQPAPLQADAGDTSVIERVVAQQFQFLAHQLDQQRQILGQQLAALSGAGFSNPSVPAPPVLVAEPPRPPAAQPAIAVDPVPAAQASAAQQSGPEPFIPYRPITPGSVTGLSPRQQAHLDALVQRYTRRTAKSKEYAQRYRAVFAENRASAGFQMATKEMLYPIVAERSEGSRFWDLDGNEYVDLAMGFGVYLFGHSPDFIRQALTAQLRKGFQLGPQAEMAGRVAERIARLTGMERVAFCNTGTEAVMVALRLARTATGRSKIVVFSGAFHGSYDSTLVRSRKGEERAVPIAPGIPRSMAEDVLVVDYDKPESLEIIKARGQELAAVLVEPVQSRRPDLQPRAFLQELRKITAETGTALIFDEVITGFRMHPRGAQGLFGVEADLALYGKVLAGGMPIGVVAGSARFMNSYDGGSWNYGDTSYPRALTSFFAGTFSKHPLTMAATWAVLNELERQGPVLQERLNQSTARLANTLTDFFVAEELPIRVAHFGSLFRFLSSSGNLDLLFYHLAEKGIYTWEGRTCFLSTAHTDEDVDTVIRTVKEAALELRAAGFFPAATHRGSNSNESRNPIVASIEVNSLPAKRGPAPAEPGRSSNRSVGFSLYYFGKYPSEFNDGKYDLLFEGARFADEHGFEAIWFPERHFHEFGGLSPNPSVLAAALARETTRIQLRAGSVVLPLHHPIRVAEEWSVVDNFSKGRIAVSFASGWHSNDFVFAPEAYGNHRELMFQQIETVQRLWRGEVLEAPGGGGNPVRVKLYPMPMQKELPIWITIVNNPGTYARAGALGAGILTNLMEQTLDELAKNLDIYRSAREQHGFDPETGRITVLLHTYMGDDLEAVRQKAQAPFCAYLKSFLGLARSWVRNQGFAVDLDHISEADLDYLLETSYKRYAQSTALIGTPSTCLPIVDRLVSIGVSEIACFVDFGVNCEAVTESFKHVYALKQLFDERAAAPISGTAVLESPAAELKPIRTMPLTEGQQGFWLFSQLSAEASSASAESMVLRLKGPFQLEAMRTAMQQVVDRHEALRTTIDSGGELQYVWLPRPIDVTVVDFSDRPEAEREAAVFQWLDEQKEPAFDLVRGPLWRCYVLNVSEEDHLLVLTIHHLVVDGWSLTVIGQELCVLYPAACRGVAANLPAPMQYHEYVQWEERERATPARAASEAYWKQQFADRVPLVDLPSDRPRPGVATYRGAREHRRVDDELYAALKKLGNQHGSTLFMTVLAVFTIFLERVTGQDDLVIGTPSIRRSLPGSEGLVGFSLNMLPVRIKLAGDPTFPEHLARVKKVVFDSYDHGDCSIGVTSRNLKLPRDPSRPVFATVQFNLNPRISIPRMGELGVDLVPRPISFTPFDLFLDAMEINGELRLDFLYNTGLFDPSTMQRWMDDLIVLLGSIVASPERRVSEFELLTPAEQQKILRAWNNTAAAYPRDVCVHELVEAQADRTPDAIAVVSNSQRLTYRELNQRANQVAHRLQKLYVGPDTLVGIHMERSVDLIVGVLGILKAGGAYVPLDPEYPPERLAFMLEDAEVSAVLTERRLHERLPQHLATPIYLDVDETLSQPSRRNPGCAIAPEHLAYVIYTSGSTGQPKGVAVTHGGLANLVWWHRERYRVEAGSRATLLASPGFDASVFELWPYLTAGASVWVVDDATRDPHALVSWAVGQQITHMFVPTPLAEAVLASWPSTSRLQWLLTGGDTLHHRPAAERSFTFVNHYGPTESTVATTATTVAAGAAETIPIGPPIANTRVYVLDAAGQPVPVGVPGELFIGGDGLARGYVHRPELTAERFVPDPFSGAPGARLYRTGDGVRWRRDGQLEFLGRRDRQVKVRGFRIELGEIEAVLAGHPGVREAVVVARDCAPNDKRLDAYVVTQPGHAPAGDELRAFARRKLPDYMVPSSFTCLEELPLTPNGKLDRRALPDPQRDRSELKQVFVAPSTPMEHVIALIWADVLAIKTIGVHDNFFDLGGHSLQGTQVVSRLRDLFAIDLSLTDLFQAPTIATMASVVADRQRGLRPASGQDVRAGTSSAAAAPGSARAPAILPRSRDEGSPPLSYAQQRLWFLNQLEPESPVYNLANALRLEGPLDVEALDRSLHEIVRRHESLRTTFVARDGQPVQVISPESQLALVRLDLTDTKGLGQDAAVQQFVAEETHRCFDLARGPLLRVSLLRLGDQTHVLVLTIHHIVSDGWSVSVFARELATLYECFSTGRPSPLAPLPIQYADYSQWQRQWLQEGALAAQLDYWKRQLAGSPAVLELPTDRLRPPVKQYRGAYHPFVLSKDLTQTLHALGRQADATLFMVLLAAFQTFLYRHTGQEDIVVGSPIANRSRVETEGLIGIFINTLALRADLAGNPSFRDVLGRVRQTALDAYAHQDLPFELLVEALQPARSLGYSPIFQVMFVLQNNPPAVLTLEGVTLSYVNVDRTTAKFDLTLSMEEGARGLSGGFQYDSDLFDAATIARMVDRFLMLLTALAANPDQQIATVPILPEAEQRRLLVDWNDAAAVYPATLVHEAFEAQVERTPGFPALVFEEEQLDYQALNRRANQLAHRLIALGVRPETLVGLHVERSIESLVGILGILKAGGAFVPIDPSYPRERVALVLDDAGIKVLVAHRHLAGDLPPHSAMVLDLDASREELAGEPETNPGVAIEPGNLAYLIYTSGSTGRPKAVAIEHRQLTNYIRGVIERLDLPAGASYAIVSTFAADLGHTMIFPALTTGGTLHVVSPERSADPEAFAAYQRHHQVDCLKIVPSHLAMLLSGRSPDGVLPRQRLVLGGEASQIGWVDRLHELAGECTIFNHYGPTETTVGVLTYRAERGQTSFAGQTLPLGRPLPNSQIYILDRQLQPTPIGVPGEISIGGAGLARGYLNRPDGTAERFIPNPFARAGERLYRTGDLGRYLPDGCVEFLGRGDQQIKLRGHRVELGEIEAVLEMHPEVAQAVVVAQYENDPTRATRLIGYVVPRSEQAPGVDALRQFLKEKLPDYMLPASFVFLAALPLTPNGKLDRHALPEPDRERPELEQAFVPPSTSLERVLAGIWSEVLDVDSVGVYDNFFELGGHSLLATQVMARVFKVFQVELPLRRLFETPTVAGLRDALVEIPGEAEQIEQTAQLLLQLSELSEEQLESQLGLRA